MKILFLTPQIPYPPQKGTALRNWGLIEGLARRHHISLLSFREEGQSEPVDGPLVTMCQDVIIVPSPERTLTQRLRDMITTAQPDMAQRLASEDYAQALRDLLARQTFDVVHVEGLEMTPYLDIIEAVSPRPLVVFDDHNCEYLLQKRAFLADRGVPARWPGAVYSWVQWRRLLRYEPAVCQRADCVLSVSREDADALRQLVPGHGVTVAPNGVDTQAYCPPHPISAQRFFGEKKKRKQQETPEVAPVLVFTGTMDFRPNVDAVLWFVQEVLPHIQTEAPNVKFYIVGQRPHKRLDVLRENPAVTLTGWVEDVRPYIAQADVYVVPLLVGGGTRLKILQALAMGKAVVSTSLGVEGYPIMAGRELLVANAAADFAGAVMGLLRAPEWREALGRAGRRFVEQQYDWRVIVPRVEAVYR